MKKAEEEHEAIRRGAKAARTWHEVLFELLCKLHDVVAPVAQRGLSKRYRKTAFTERMDEATPCKPFEVCIEVEACIPGYR